ncbi:hypothetical protein [Nocardioides sp.]|uniref:hypothetical protein n=1 Tax=Nocardioides sp. TaxID=35761 RepID=UPI0035683981
MTELSHAVGPALHQLRTLWWVVLVAALAAGLSTYVTARPPASVTYGVVNTRTVTPLPNDRTDLIVDLQTAATIPSVLERPAALAKMSVDELRASLEVSRIGSSTLARITFTSGQDDPATNRDVVTAFVDDASVFLSQSTDSDPGPSTEMTEVLAEERQVREEIAEAVASSAGVEPDAAYAAMRDRLLRDPSLPSTRDSKDATRLRRMFEAAQRFEQLEVQLNRATNRVTALEAQEFQQRLRESALRGGIPVTFEGDVPADGDGTALVRRTFAGGVAGGLLAAAVILALGRRRRA